MEVKLADLYAIVRVNIDDGAIRGRETAVEALASRAEEDTSFIPALGSIVLNGELSTGGSIPSVLDTIRKADHAFSPLSNKVEFQILCYATLSKLLESDRTRVAAAAVFAYGIDPQIGVRGFGPKYREELQKSSHVAADIIEHDAQELRKRFIVDTFAPVTVPTTLDANFPAATNKALQVLAERGRAIAAYAEVGREETELLWWHSSRYSLRANLRYGDIDTCYRWVQIAVDASQVVLLPPLRATETLLRDVARNSYVDDSGVTAADLLAGVNSKSLVSGSVVDEYPPLFPVSHLMMHSGQLAGSGKNGWGERVGIRGKVSLSHEHWAVWLYKEQVLVRFLS